MSFFKLRATGATGVMDKEEARAALAALVDPEFIVNLRGLPSGRNRVAIGSDIDALVNHAADLADDRGVYYCLNPLRKGWTEPARASAVVRRRQLLVDIDPIRGVGLNATATEKKLAHAMAVDVLVWLGDQGWPAPILIDSGNGWHLIYRIDLPNNTHSGVLIRNFLLRLAKRFERPGAEIDRSVHDAARIAKLPGTWARKGPHSEERPHRLCRMIFCPAVLEGVSAELLASTGDPQEESGAASAWKRRARGDNGAYARVALDRECARVRMAIPGPREGRNNALNRAAFSLGQLIGGGCLAREEAEDRLSQAAIDSGLDPQETQRTIRSGIEAGIKEPRQPPEKAKKTATASPDAVAAMERITVSGSEVTPQRVDWLLQNRIAKRFISVFAGQTGLGKSFVMADIAARVTRGDAPPVGNGAVLERGSVLWVGEDPYDYVTLPRLLEMGADPAMVHFLKWEAMSHFQLDNTKMLERAFQEAGRPALLAIDPPANFLGNRDEHKNAEVRQGLLNLVVWLRDHDTSCVFLTHVNKNTGKGVEALNRVMGSVAWTSVSRVAHAFAADGDDKTKRLFVPMKNNLGILEKGLAYRIVKTDNLARVEWLGEVDTTADEAMSGERGSPKLMLATEWMTWLFRQKTEWPGDEFWASAREHGISRGAIDHARAKLSLPRPRRIHGIDGRVDYVWWVPPDWPHLVEKSGGEPDAAVF